jgi:hypothetical protein
MAKAILIVLTGAAIGGVLGYYKVFCLSGECSLTGSWQGGAAIGGLLALTLLGGCPCSKGACRVPRRTSESPTDADPDQDNPYRSA